MAINNFQERQKQSDLQDKIETAIDTLQECWYEDLIDKKSYNKTWDNLQEISDKIQRNLIDFDKKQLTSS